MGTLRIRVTLVLLAMSPILVSSCGGRDPLVDEMIHQQAKQQESISRQSEELTKASQQLVEADANARREQAEQHAKLQSELQSQQQNLDQQRDSLEAERREIASRRHRDPLLAAALTQIATLLIASLPVVVLILLIRAARNEPSDVPLGDLLVHDLTSDAPLLLPAPIIGKSVKLLPAPDASGPAAEEPPTDDSPASLTNPEKE